MIKNMSHGKKMMRRMLVDDNGHLVVEYQDEFRSSFRLARVALVKQDCYQDLWIGGENESYQDLIRSTQMRVGPIGLITLCQCKFFILKRSPGSIESDYFQRQSFLSDSDIAIVQKYRAEMINPSLELTSSRFHSDYAQSSENINWSKFDLVVSINSSVPYKVRKRYPDVLWACMPGEGLCHDHSLHHLNYDCYLTHNWASTCVPDKGIYVDFPYTFLGPNDLMRINWSTGILDKKGIYLEINSGINQERPTILSSIPEAIMLQAQTGLNIKVHKGTIIAHLTDLITSKYFIKLGGRPTRGNGFMEAISAHSLILMRRSDCFGNMTLPEESYFTNIDHLIQKILLLEANQDLYYSILEKQRQCLFQYGIYMPLKQLAYVFNSRSRFSFLLIKELEHLRLELISLWNRLTQKIRINTNIGFKSKVHRNS